MRRFLALALLVAAILAGCAARAKPDDSLDRIRQTGILRVATDPSYPPFSYVDGGGELAGYDVELARELAARLGVEATFVGIEVTTVFDALTARKADVAISAVSPAWEYAKEIGFSRSYFDAGQVFVVRERSGKLPRPGELGRAVLGVEIGSAAELEGRKLAKAEPGVSLVPFESLEAGAAALAAGEFDALIADRVTAAMLVQSKSELGVIGEPFTHEPYVIAARRANRALLKEIDTILEAMAKDGFLRTLERRFALP